MPYARCEWRGKLLKCEQQDLLDLFKVGSHVSTRRSPQPPRMTRAMQNFAHEMADQGLKPARIRTGLMRKFNLGPDTLPQLKVVQRSVYNYLSKTVGANDYLDDLRRMIREAAFTGQEQDFDAFSFTWRTEEDGRPYVGSGADENPFLVGVSSKTLLRQADQNPATFVLHMDATFKLNHVDYPVFVVGITDCCRKFHLMAIFVSSQRKEIHFSEALMALRKVYSQVTGKQLAVRFAMGDADDAQYNAVVRVLGANYEVEVLMCFYHVAAKVHEKTRKLHHSLYTVVTSGVHDLHFAASELEYEEAKTRILNDFVKTQKLP
ncbi:hypothetical protein F442_14274 [Phytophthora nicotianae P10297]|uniref:MULE transposase domain-containing protein n=1 Tax=Phytophthora nicotianae P10297 TaxID=1317064 RepID=W2YT57_PHYNI|nr:hypothetical protein F442_14274 [Phytophthora nicotianae P10297]